MCSDFVIGMYILICRDAMTVLCYWLFFFFKQMTAYERRISDWSSDVCSSDLYIPGSDILGAREAFYRDQIATALVEERRRTEVAEAERDTARQELAALRTSAEATLADTHAATEQSPASPSDSESALQSVQEALLRYDVEMREYHRQCWCEDWSRGTIHVPAYYQAQNARRALEGAIKRWTDRHEAEFEAQAEHEMEAMDATAGDTAAANDQSDQGNTPARPS